MYDDDTDFSAAAINRRYQARQWAQPPVGDDSDSVWDDES
jgi:hypothetical protein